MSTVVAHSAAARTSRTGAGRGPFAARLRVMLLFAVITILGPACAAGGSESERSISPLSGGEGRSSLLLEALTRSVVATYGRTAVVSRQPRDRFLREIVERAGVLEDARSAGLPLDLLVDSYVATAGAGSAGGVELLDAGDESVARSLGRPAGGRGHAVTPLCSGRGATRGGARLAPHLHCRRALRHAALHRRRADGRDRDRRAGDRAPRRPRGGHARAGAARRAAA